MGQTAQAELDAWTVHHREPSHDTYMVSVRPPRNRPVNPKEGVIYRRRCLICFKIIYEGPANGDQGREP